MPLPCSFAELGHSTLQCESDSTLWRYPVPNPYPKTNSPASGKSAPNCRAGASHSAVWTEFYSLELSLAPETKNLKAFVRRAQAAGAGNLVSLPSDCVPTNYLAPTLQHRIAELAPSALQYENDSTPLSYPVPPNSSKINPQAEIHPQIENLKPRALQNECI